MIGFVSMHEASSGYFAPFLRGLRFPVASVTFLSASATYIYRFPKLGAPFWGVSLDSVIFWGLDRIHLSATNSSLSCSKRH